LQRAYKWKVRQQSCAICALTVELSGAHAAV
jgi:hypothetical protein